MLIGSHFRSVHPQERNNLTNVSSFRYSGLVHKKTLAIVPADKTGFSVLYKKSKYQVSNHVVRFGNHNNSTTGAPALKMMPFRTESS